MKTHILNRSNHSFKSGMICPHIQPNIKQDTLFILDNQPVGFFIKSIDAKMSKVANFADREFRSSRVPKEKMQRSGSGGVEQFSTIIGATPMRRRFGKHYNNISTVHQKKSAKEFIRAMLYLSSLAGNKIKEIMPEQYNTQKKIIEDAIPERLRFGKLFTSSISNYNIPASFHRDNGNLKNTVNVIVNKKQSVVGGNLYVPDFDLCFDGSDNSMIVYPAWLSLHGVTPIKPMNKLGYRNSLVFYPYDLRK